MSDKISIIHNDTGSITNRYFGTKTTGQWIVTDESAWPEDESGSDEIPRYYYDPKTGEITVQYETVASDPAQ
jgi:hypothetical protein